MTLVPTWSQVATACPALPSRPAQLDPADDAQSTTTFYQVTATGGAAYLSRPGRDANAKRGDMLGRYGGGCPAIAEGCLITASATPNSIDISPGAILLDGAIPVGQINPATGHVPRLPLTEALTDNATNHVWFLQDGSVSIRTDLSAPATPAVYRGRAVMLAGTLTAIDYSGSMEMRWGVPYRRTGDAGAPTDTPPAGASFLAETAGGLYWWTGTAYKKWLNPASVANTDLAASAQALIPGAPAVTPGVQTSHTRPVTIQIKDAGGSNIAAKRLVRIWLSDSALGGETATVPDGGLAITTGALLKAQTANVHLLVMTDATGAAVIAITHSAAITYHMVAEFAGQITDASVALT